MEKIVFKTENLASSYIVNMMGEILKKKKDALLCLAAGHTSLPVFAEMIKAQNTGKIDFCKAHFVSMDEWKNIPSDNYGSCSNFLYRNCFEPLKIPETQIHVFDGMQNETECTRIKKYIENHGGIDFILLGMGLNGHLAMNEPGCSIDSSVRETGLADTTVKVAAKYFQNNMPEITAGYTIGIREILESKSIVLAVFGEHKKAAVQNLLKANVTADCPASYLKTSDHAYLILDEASA